MPAGRLQGHFMAKKRIQVTSSHQAELVKILRSVGYQHGPWQVFRDFVAMGAIALSNAADHRYKVEWEAKYMHIVGRYSKEHANELARGFASVVMGLEAGMCDFLGSLYMSLELGDAWKGQFFTPYEICRVMAAISVSGITDEAIEAKGFISVSDPCIGGGAMVIAAAHALKDAGINYQQHMHAVGADIDIVSVHMAYIQLSLLHVPAVIQHSDSLSREVWSSWRTPAHVLGFWDAKLRRTDANARLTQSKPEETDTAPMAPPNRTTLCVSAINLREQFALF